MSESKAHVLTYGGRHPQGRGQRVTLYSAAAFLLRAYEVTAHVIMHGVSDLIKWTKKHLSSTDTPDKMPKSQFSDKPSENSIVMPLRGKSSINLS